MVFCLLFTERRYEGWSFIYYGNLEVCSSILEILIVFIFPPPELVQFFVTISSPIPESYYHRHYQMEEASNFSMSLVYLSVHLTMLVVNLTEERVVPQ